jgi:hypothetical protein
LKNSKIKKIDLKTEANRKSLYKSESSPKSKPVEIVKKEENILGNKKAEEEETQK